MESDSESKLSTDEVIEKAFDYFDRYVVRNKGQSGINHVLLEGLKPEDDDWLVAIGFDAGRFQESTATLSFGERTTQPIREIRRFLISGRDGSLKRIS